MKISQLIAALEALKKEHGDIQVGYSNQEFCFAEEIDQVTVRAACRGTDAYPCNSDEESLGDFFVEIE